MVELRLIGLPGSRSKAFLLIKSGAVIAAAYLCALVISGWPYSFERDGVFRVDVPKVYSTLAMVVVVFLFMIVLRLAAVMFDSRFARNLQERDA